jgi:type VI secretion system protein ImpH
MAGTDRSAPADLSAELTERAAEFDFFAALRLLESEHAGGPRLGKGARGREERVRLGQEPRLAFPAGSLASYAPAAGGLPPKLAVLLFGLFGSGGPLPLHLTVHAMDRRRHTGDETFIDFCDLLQHRLIALYYRAWADARPHVQHDRPGQDRFRLYVGALAGFGLPALLDRDALPDRFRFHHAGLIGCQVSHAERVVTLVEDLLGVQAELEEFVGGWLDLPERLRTRLGQASARLGLDAVVGIASFQRQHRCRLRLGPLDLAAYLALLPGGERLERLSALLRLLLGDPIEWDLALILEAEEVPPLRLDGNGRLGWTTWLASQSRTQPADDLVLRPVRAAA